MTGAGYDAAGRSALSRSELVSQAAGRWSTELSVLGGRDPLLSYRDLKVGTLDLAAAEAGARKLLLEGEQVLISKLFPYEPLRTSALRSVRAIRDKARELAEERGLPTCYLAVGVATWANPFAARRPTAPVMLRSANVQARDPAETDFTITVADDPFVNPVLLHALDTQLGLRFDADDLRDPAGQLRYATVVERLREFAPPHVVDGFSVAHRAVIATFSTAPIALAEDLAAFGVDLSSHDVVAALAGDQAAAAAIARRESDGALNYRVLDTDAEQDSVIAAAIGDGHLRISAPPGTGRTQTVASAVAELVGRGQRVLVVGQKRAVLDDLVRRLGAAGLDDVVVDVDRLPAADAARQLTETVQRLVENPPWDGHGPGGAAAGLAAELDSYRDAIHRTREPWGSTVYEAMVLAATAPEFARTSARIKREVLSRSVSTADVRADLREFSDLEGLTLTEDASPWFGSDVDSERVADILVATARRLRERSLPALRDAATRAAVEVGLAGPTTISECLDAVDLLIAVSRTQDTFGPQIWDEPLEDLAAATGDRSARSAHPTGVGFMARRRLRRRVADLTGLSGRQHRQRAHDDLQAARDQRAAWRIGARDGKAPRIGSHLGAAVESAKGIRHDLATLAEANPRTEDLDALPFSIVARRLDELIADESHLRSLPRLYQLQDRLSAAGLDELIAELRRRDVAADQVEAVFDYAWYTSLLDLWRAGDPTLARFDRAAHERRLDEFHYADLAEKQAAAQRVLDARNARFAAVADEYEGQAAVLTATHSVADSPRELLNEAPNVTLAAVPCWVMSPLGVAGTLPPRQLFNVVIIEDAGRLTVAEAVPSIARARRMVLVGDDGVALAPFTTAVEPAADPDEQEGPWAHEPPPSVAEYLSAVLPSRSLTGQFRVRDDRLVGFAARTIYAGRLATVPGVGGADRLTLDVIDAPASNDDPVDSSSAEVARVVELILQHVRTRPHESLGVVTLGPRHAERLDTALRQALIRAPEAARYLGGDAAEPFFVKDVERVGGDVRDAVILSLGYGRSSDGRILYRFGALGRPGGERRLAAATTGARERLTVVATFSAEDLSPRRLTTPGAVALGEFLTYVQDSGMPGPTGAESVIEPTTPPEVPSEATPADTPATEPTAHTPTAHTPAQPVEPIVTEAADLLASTVAERLRAAGVTASMVIGYGGPAGIGVAVKHPTRSTRFVLAVETDGAAYAARRTARERERLRPSQLMRLGWNVHRVWSAAWAADPDGETRRLIAAYEQAVIDADAYDWALAAAEADAIAGMPEESRNAEREGPDHAADDSGEGPADGPGEVSADGTEGAEHDADSDEPVVEAPPRTGDQPAVPAGQMITEYTLRELVAVVRWVESDGVTRHELDVADMVADELDLSAEDARTHDVLRHAVRVTRAGAPGLSAAAKM